MYFILKSRSLDSWHPNLPKFRNLGKPVIWLLPGWFTLENRYEHIRSLEHDSEFRFFEIRRYHWFEKRDMALSNSNQQRHPDTVDNLRLGSEFRDKLKRLVDETPFLEMLLRSKASNNSDRFNAILPLHYWYELYVKNEDTISTWNITEMTSVRMKVRQWLYGDRNLHLVYFQEPMSARSGVLSLPSFDTERTYMLNNILPGQLEGVSLNYDYLHMNSMLKINDRNDEATENDTIQLRYSMYLYPEYCQASRITLLPQISHIINAWTWKELLLEPTVDQFTWTRIPLLNPIEYLAYERTHEYDTKRTDYHKTLNLIGCSNKNVWILLPERFHKKMHEYVNPLDKWIWQQRDDNHPGFCIY